MRSNQKRVFGAVALALVFAFVAHVRAALVPQNLTVITKETLVSNFKGDGVEIDPATISYLGSPLSAGTFTGEANILGIDGGVVLSTGNIATIVGPNTNNGSAGTNLLGPGDTDLNLLSSFPTHDATVLEFDFVPDKNKVFFQYVFASEEYNEFVNTRFNDVFAFYVGLKDGANWISRVNCATIDGLPVSINTINKGKKSGGVFLPPISHPELFINNDTDLPAASKRNTQMDGLTKVLSCQATVVANVPNHIKLAIADSSDGNLDSNVFLRAHSFTTTPPLTIIKRTNTTNNDVGPAPLISAGAPVLWSYEVTNSGFDTLTSVSVTDDKLGAISCPNSTLPPLHTDDTSVPNPLATMTCLASGTAILDDYANVGTVVGSSDLIGSITDSNPDRYFGAQPSLHIVTRTNHSDNDAEPGPSILAGAPVLWTYEVKNTGNVMLNAVTVTDTTGVAVDCSLVPGGPQKTTLLPGETMTCSATAAALVGQHQNTGLASGSIQVLNVSGTLDTVTRTDSNIDHYFGADPKLSIVKKTNGSDNNLAPGVLVRATGPIRWTYEVKNTGNVALTNVHVGDTLAGAVSCPAVTDPMAVGATAICTLDGTALKGQQTNGASATGATAVVDINGSAVTAQAPPASDVEFYFGADPQITLVKKTNTTDNNAAPGVLVRAGGPIRWTYEVKNTGNVPLTSAHVVDTIAGPVSCPTLLTTLAVDAIATCSLDGTALKDQQTNGANATAAVTVVDVNGAPAEAPAPPASDVEFYFGADPKLTLVKRTNGSDNNAAPGVVVRAGGPVRWTYELRNTGNVPLTTIQVVDTPAGPVACPGVPSPFAVDAVASCVLDGTALKDQQHNGAIASGAVHVIDVDGASVEARSPDAADDEFYFGADPRVTLVKKTNGFDNKVEPYVTVLAGAPVRWSYDVKNTGNVALKTVQVSDPAGPVTCSGNTLAIGETGAACTLPGTALGGSQHVSTAKATGAVTVTGIDGVAVDAFSPDALDDDNYFGADPHVTLVKKTNTVDNKVEPFVSVLAGGPIRWTYFVTNTGNVPLKNLVVTDPSGPVSCSDSAVAIGATALPCSLPGVALIGTQHASNAKAVGVVTVVNAEGTAVDASSPDAFDDDNYFGADPHVNLVKMTNDTDNNAAPGLLVRAEQPIHWTYFVKNTGNVALGNVHVTDTPGGPVTCPSLAVGPGETMAACALDGIALKGGQTNAATVTGNTSVVNVDGALVDAPATAGDVEYYFGADPRITLVKKTNGADNDSAPGRFILVGDEVKWTYEVTNTGNVPLTNVVITDDTEGPICTVVPDTLAVGQSSVCTKSSVAKRDQQSNIGRASADFRLTAGGAPEIIRSSNADYYFGAAPGISLVKKTIDTDSDAGPGPSILVGSQVTWTYGVTNTGNVDLTNVTVTDDREGAICTLATLTVGQRIDCSKVGTAKPGPYANTGTATGHLDIVRAAGPATVPVSSSNADHYFGADPRITIVKKTVTFVCESKPDGYDSHDAYGKDNGYGKNNGGGYGKSGSGGYGHADWGYGGNYGGPSDPSCGSDSNHGWDSHGKPDTMKRVETDNNTAPGPFVKVGAAIAWTYTVTNTGNVPLADIVVTDDKEGPICTIALLAVGQTAPPCTKSSTAVDGQYENTGTAAGTYGPVFVNGVFVPTVPVTATDVDHYFGARPAIDIVKKTNGTDNYAPGPGVVVGSNVTWTYEITNTGNVTLTNVDLTDDRIGDVWCPATTLPPSPAAAATMTCWASGKAVSGQYKNTGTVTAASPFGPVSAADDDYYWGISILPPYDPHHGSHDPFPYKNPGYGGPVCR